MKLSDTAAALAEEIYKQNLNSMRIQGVRWNLVRTMSELPTVGVWINVPARTVIIAVRGTANLHDVGQNIHIFNDSVEKTTNHRTTMRVLNEVRNEYKDYQIVITGHSYGGSVAVKMGKENADVKAFGFNTGTGYKAMGIRMNVVS